MDADVKRKISRAKLPPPLIKPKFQPLIQFCQGLSIRYAITFVSDPPTLQFFLAGAVQCCFINTETLRVGPDSCIAVSPDASQKVIVSGLTLAQHAGTTPVQSLRQSPGQLAVKIYCEGQ